MSSGFLKKRDIDRKRERDTLLILLDIPVKFGCEIRIVPRITCVGVTCQVLKGKKIPEQGNMQIYKSHNYSQLCIIMWWNSITYCINNNSCSQKK